MFGVGGGGGRAGGSWRSRLGAGRDGGQLLQHPGVQPGAVGLVDEAEQGQPLLRRQAGRSLSLAHRQAPLGSQLTRHQGLLDTTDHCIRKAYQDQVMGLGYTLLLQILLLMHFNFM